MGAGGRPPKYTPIKYYKDFKKKYPNFEKSIVRWYPHKAIPDCIELWSRSGEIFIYSYVQQKVWLTKRKWK